MKLITYYILKCEIRRNLEEEKEEIWLSPTTKAIYTQKNPKSNVATQKRHQKLRLHNDGGPT